MQRGEKPLKHQIQEGLLWEVISGKHILDVEYLMLFCYNENSMVWQERKKERDIFMMNKKMQ